VPPPLRLHVVDGTFELFRAYFSKRPGHTAPGRADGTAPATKYWPDTRRPWDAKATVGVAGSLLALLADPEEAVTHLAVAFDRPVRSFRNDLFDGYKTDDGVIPELLAQFGPVEEAARAVGAVVWSMDAWEADDALATAAARFGESFDQIRILTPDKDLGQMLRGTRVVQVDRIRNRVIDEATLLEARGVTPASIPDLLALVGDTADGIPGLPGIGDKTAATLLRRWVHLDAIPEDPAAWDVDLRGAAKIAGTLTARREDALLYRELATLVTDVPLPETTPDDLLFRGVPKERFLAWCDRLGVDSLRTRPELWS
jgi:5'-3' exonuclease